MIRKLIKLPVMLVAIFIAIMFILDSINIGFAVDFTNQSILSLVIFIFGLVIIAIGGLSFRRARTTVNPVNPEQASQLVTTGIYNVSRNPMYIGFLVWIIACTLFIGNIINLLLLPLYILLVNYLYIIPEEKALEKLFEKDFKKYKTRVRRWI